MSNEFASAGLTAGQLNAIVKKLGGHDSALKFLRDDLIVFDSARGCDEKNDVIRFSITSKGITGPQWIKYFEEVGVAMSSSAEAMLRSGPFVPTNGITTKVAILRGTPVKKDYDKYSCIESMIWNVAKWRGLDKPNIELICLIMEKILNGDIELIQLNIIMLFADELGYFAMENLSGRRWFRVYSWFPYLKLSRNYGFVFVEP